jgi:hypothetical protein
MHKDFCPYRWGWLGLQFTEPIVRPASFGDHAEGIRRGFGNHVGADPATDARRKRCSKTWQISGWVDPEQGGTKNIKNGQQWASRRPQGLL